MTLLVMIEGARYGQSGTAARALGRAGQRAHAPQIQAFLPRTKRIAPGAEKQSGIFNWGHKAPLRHARLAANLKVENSRAFQRIWRAARAACRRSIPNGTSRKGLNTLHLPQF